MTRCCSQSEWTRGETSHQSLTRIFKVGKRDAAAKKEPNTSAVSRCSSCHISTKEVSLLKEMERRERRNEEMEEWKYLVQVHKDLCVSPLSTGERDSPQSPVGLSPSRSRSVWPSYPRIHLASPRRPATPRPGSHSETAIKASSASSSSSSAVNYQDKLMEPRATWNVFIPVTWAPQSSRCSTETSVRPRWRWNLELYTSHWDREREKKRLQHQANMIQTINNTHPPLHLHSEFHMCRQL